jgi:thiol-disulfide isomerase/thioredoxin
MKNIKKIMTLLAVLTISMATAPKLFAQVKFQKTGLDEAKAKAAKANKLLFVDVYATWCGPCKRLDSQVFNQEKVASVLNQKFVALKIDGDDQKRVMDVVALDVEAYPSLFIINPKTDEITKFQGFIDADDLLEELDFALHPEKHPVKKARAALQTSASKDNHMTLLTAMLADRSENHEEIATDVENYITKFPNLDLSNAIDQLVFSRHINDIDHPLVIKFLKEQSGFDDDLRETKFLSILQHYLNQAIEQENVGIVNEQYHKLLPYFEDLFDSKESKDELFDKIQQIYEASV